VIRPRHLGVSGLLVAALLAGCQADPAPAETEVAPILTPDQALKRFSLPAGYRIELVAAEPLVHDPIAIDFDADGRMYVVEMRGYMPNVRGEGEDQPVGRIVVLEDRNDDGRMDTATTFMDSLVLPRAVKVLDHGVLVGVPPHLWLAHDTTGDLRADIRQVVRDDYGSPKDNPEHSANGLLWGFDNWIHNANYPGELRLRRDGQFAFRPTPSEGQWGISADEYGRFYRNSNEDPVRTDLIPAHYATRNANQPALRGVYEQLTSNVAVFPARKTPGINRGYRERTMRPDSTLAHYTAAGAPTAYVGDVLPAEMRGSVFVAEPVGNFVGRFVLEEASDGTRSARVAYDSTEFLRSTDERFRPVNLATAPDGSLYVVDMYRGIIQHRTYITGYLEQKIRERGLESGIGMGRIYRVTHTSSRREDTPKLSRKTPAELVRELSHPNGWRRITAQRLIVERGDRTIAPALRDLLRTSPDDRVRLHALWTLDGLGEADQPTVALGLRDASPHVRAAAVRVAEPWLSEPGDSLPIAIIGMTQDSAVSVRRQVAASLGELPAARRDSAFMVVVARDGADPVVADLVVSGLRGRELSFLRKLIANQDDERSAPTLRALAAAVVRSGDIAGVQHVVAWAGESARPRWQRLALLTGADVRGGQSTGRLTALPARPSALLAMAQSSDSALRARATAVANALTWPGKPTPSRPPPRPLTAEEQQRFAAGREQYATTCAACHQATGAGLTGVAKTLVGSAWVMGDPNLLIRIALHGKEGEMLMPPVGGALTNEQLAAVLTYVRRSWGNEALPVDAAQVAEIRGATLGRKQPWTEAELARLR
jgi:mono/diheme cytochrome c family protein/glucose/arabinose dehydrogenase